MIKCRDVISSHHLFANVNGQRSALPKMQKSKHITPSNNMKALLKRIKSISKKYPKDKIIRIPQPILPKGKLSDQDQWASLVWNIDTAEANGKRALHGLTLALTRIIQADILESLLLDVRQPNQALDTPNELLWDRKLPVRKDGSTMRDLLRPRRRTSSQELMHTAVIPKPWEPWRLSRSLENLGPGGKWKEWRQTDNFHAVGWTPWPLVWVDNGNHSTMAAILTHGGKFIVSECFDAKELLFSVYCDGKNWLRTDNDKVIAAVNSLPMAGIFEIGRRLVKAPKKTI